MIGDHFLRTPGLTVVPGTAIYQHVDHRTTPSALLTSAMAFSAIHDRIIAVSIVTMPVPHVHVMKRYTVHSTFRTMYPLRYENVTIRFGFKDDINIPAALEEAVAQGLMPQIKHPCTSRPKRTSHRKIQGSCQDGREPFS